MGENALNVRSATAFTKKMKELGVEKFKFGELEVVFAQEYHESASEAQDGNPEAALEEMIRKVNDLSPDELEDIADRERHTVTKSEVTKFVNENYRSAQ